MPKCVYCNYEKEQSEFTQEHVIPKGIGGNIYPINPFSLEGVCKRCNNLCGTYVDGPFITNWFIKNHGTEELYKYANIAKNPILPLRYMGPCNGTVFEDRLCELWLGPTGDRIYHFHRPYPEEPEVARMVGVPTHLRKAEIDHGFAFLFVRSNNPVWYPTIFLSFIEQFKGSALYLGNGATPHGGGFLDIPEEMRRLHTHLMGLNGKTHHVDLKLDLRFGDRFMAKVALGLGTLFLGDTFTSSQSSDLLRLFLWTKKAKDRENIPIMGTGFFNESDNESDQLLNWPGGHVVALLPIKGAVALHVSFFEKHCATIRVSSEPEHWSGREFGEGIVYVIIPGLQKCVGPKSLLTFIAHKNSSFKDKDLLKLETEMRQYKELPPYDI